MSIQIYRDTENINPNAGFPKEKKFKRGVTGEDGKPKVLKQNKRVALSTISQNVAHRVQPSRAAKDKTVNVNAFQVKGVCDVKPGFKIFSDVAQKSFPDDIGQLHKKHETIIPKDSPMVLSPILSNSNSSNDLKSSLIEDIDLKTDPLLGVPEYAHDIHAYLKKAEMKFRPKPNYMRKQVDINASMRSILVDWLVEVAEEYQLKPQTLFLTVNYIDRFLSFMSVRRGKLQLVGAACMLVAAKFEEIYPPEVKEFVYITDDTFNAKQILGMEHLILKTLSFDLSVPTCRDFLSRYLAAAGAPSESVIQFLSQYLCELVIVDNEAAVTYLPSMIAASAVLLAHITLKMQPWTKALEHYTGYTMSDLSRCVEDILTIYKASLKHPQQAIQSKYKAPKFGCVAEIPPPENLTNFN